MRRGAWEGLKRAGSLGLAIASGSFVVAWVLGVSLDWPTSWRVVGFSCALLLATLVVLVTVARSSDPAAVQAQRVTLSVEEKYVREGAHSKSLAGWTLHVSNYGDASVHVDGVELVWTEQWDDLRSRGESRLPTESVDIWPSGFELQPKGTWSHNVDVHTGKGQPDFAIIEYRDEWGNVWQRRSDTRAMRRWFPRPIRWWQRGVQWLTRHVPGFGTVLIRPLERRAIKAVQKHGADRMPLSLRYCRWAWGEWGAGEDDEWLKPDGAPQLWGFNELPWREDV